MEIKKITTPRMFVSARDIGKSALSQNANVIIPTPALAISATTAGRRPFNTPRIIPTSPYLKYKYAINSMMITDGNTNPAVAAIAPIMPAILAPTNVAALIPIGPGVIWEIVKISTNSCMVIQ